VTDPLGPSPTLAAANARKGVKQMKRATISTNRILALAAMVLLTATTIPVVSGFGTGGERQVMPSGCPPTC